MASSLPRRISPSKVFCRYHQMGRCAKGDSCEFVHQAASASNQDSLATDPGQGHSTSHGIDERHSFCQGLEGNDCTTQRCCHGPNPDSIRGLSESPDHSSNVLERPAFDNVFGTTLMLHKDAAMRAAPNKMSPAAVARRPEDWVKAPEFVPGQMWQFRGAVKSPVVDSSISNASDGAILPPAAQLYTELCETCPSGGSSVEGISYPGQGCDLVSLALADVCELCGSVMLATLTEDERQKHIAECIGQHEHEMERSFAIQRSQEKMCGICTDVIWEKAVVSEQRFGILSNCNHVFCLQCIRKWRSTKHFENKIVRACPECRVKSDFVTPSRYWVEDKEDKKKLIEEYKMALSKKPCKYFDKGRGECPFNEKCFYLHAHPDGRIASPKPAYRRRRPPTTSSSQTSESSGGTNSTPHAVLYEILAGWPLDRWEDLFFHLNLFELSLPSTSDEEDDDDDDDDFDDSDLSAIL